MTGMVDADKVLAVREYLQREFPSRILYDFYDPARSAQVFQIGDSLGTVTHLAVVRADFFAARSGADIRGFLEVHRLARALLDAGARPILVTAAGLAREAA